MSTIRQAYCLPFVDRMQMLRLAAGTQADINKNLPSLKSSLIRLESRLAEPDAAPNVVLPVYMRTIIPFARSVAHAILSTRSIPLREAKSFEMAYRLIETYTGRVKDWSAWWDKNKERFYLLTRAAINYPVREDGGDEAFDVGPFRILNTIHLKDAALATLRKDIAEATRAIAKNVVPGFTKAAYGDIHIVAKLTKAHHAAWYNIADDSVYVRVLQGQDLTHSFIHEIGHRYWRKFANPESKREWERHHSRLMYADVPVTMPGVGDIVPVPIRGTKGPTVVTKVTWDKLYIESDGVPSAISRKSLRDFLDGQERANRLFPTRYSLTDAEEHFCEALAQASMGKLPKEQLEAFNNIWK